MNSPRPVDLTRAVADELTALKSVQRDITNLTLATALGLSTRQVIRMMKGDADIGLRQLETMATVLNSNYEDVLDGAYKRMA